MAPGDRAPAVRAQGETIFAWTPFVPFGKVTATYRVGTEVHQATGTGYHDHNWMNKQMGHLIDHWWWAKGQVGTFTFVTAHLVAAKKYGYTPLEWFMLARDGKVIADDSTKVAFGKSGSEIDEHTGKPVPDQISFDYRDGRTRYLLTYSRQKTLVSQKLIDFTSGLQKLVAEMIRYPGGYLRFSALVGLDRYQGDELVEHQEGPCGLRTDVLRTPHPRRTMRPAWTAATASGRDAPAGGAAVCPGPP